MEVAKVIGTVVSTRKDEALVGFKLLVVELESVHTDRAAERLVAVDYLGAGVSERVLVTRGSSARAPLERNAPTDATIVGIIDTVDLAG
jgi:ethanolamine utilization protein EutN